MLYSVAKRQKEIMEKPHEGISTEFSDEDWQINSSPFPKISKFTYDIVIFTPKRPKPSKAARSILHYFTSKIKQMLHVKIPSGVGRNNRISDTISHPKSLSIFVIIPSF
jgi:hypothetical protein